MIGGEISWWSVIGGKVASLPGTCVHVTIMSGLELLTNSRIVNTICYEASDGRLDYIRTD